MRMELIEKLALGITITDKDISDELEEICEREHSCSCTNCPIYQKMTAAEIEANKYQCRYAGGIKMLAYIRGEKIKY
jgi:hypothetical protein